MPSYSILSQSSQGALTKFQVTFVADDGYSETQTYIVASEADIALACQAFNDARLLSQLPPPDPVASAPVVLASDAVATAAKASIVSSPKPMTTSSSSVNQPTK